MSKEKQNESIIELILFSMHLLELKKKKCTFENITRKCFELFPETFSFDNISKWPDARKLDRPLRSLRKEKMIGGGPKNFYLTKKGKKMTLNITKKFKQKKLF